MALAGYSKKHRKARRVRRRSKAFAGTPAQHRSDAASFGKQARGFAQRARAAAKHGDCRTALHLFGVTAYYAGLAAGNRKYAGKSGYLGGSRFGSRTHGLQKTVFKACRIAP